MEIAKVHTVSQVPETPNEWCLQLGLFLGGPSNKDSVILRFANAIPVAEIRIGWAFQLSIHSKSLEGCSSMAAQG